MGRLVNCRHHPSRSSNGSAKDFSDIRCITLLLHMVVSNPPGDITIEDRSQRNSINSWAHAARLAGPPERSSCFSTTKGLTEFTSITGAGRQVLLKPTAISASVKCSRDDIGTTCSMITRPSSTIQCKPLRRDRSVYQVKAQPMFKLRREPENQGGAVEH